jgi:hypothetical protein
MFGMEDLESESGVLKRKWKRERMKCSFQTGEVLSESSDLVARRRS